MILMQPSKGWAKRIQDEWRILEKDLPGNFYIVLVVLCCIFSFLIQMFCKNLIRLLSTFMNYGVAVSLFFMSFSFLLILIYEGHHSFVTETIFVRVYESRMDLLRAVIIGAEGTPYHDGLFFFDLFFPSSYPNVPPVWRLDFYCFVNLHSLLCIFVIP